MKCQRHPQALPFLQRARDLGKTDIGPLLGECLMQLKKLEESEAAFTQAYESGTTPQPGLALLRLAQGKPEGAASLINRTLSAVMLPG